MPIWVVTGGSGFIGRHALDAARAVAGPGDAVWALGRRVPYGWPPEAFVHVDLESTTQLARVVTEVAPDIVIHTAGATSPASAERLYRANTGITAQLLEVVAAMRRPVRVVLCGSAAELGPVPSAHLPIGEDCPCRPVDAYGLSKWFASAAGLRAVPPLEVVVARVFNPIGPGMPPSQAFGRFAQSLRHATTDPVPLSTRDLSSRRDFIDVRDVARALVALALQGRAKTIYHIGTGRSHAVRDGLEHLISLSGRAVVVDEHAGLSRGPLDSRADVSRIIDHTGWRPRISLEQSLADLWHESARPAAAPAPRRSVA